MSDTPRDDQPFKVWKHYADAGGADKNWMIQIVTWLLGFSASIIGFYATGKLANGAAAVILLGILISLLAAALYGAYAAWNWSIADQIAKKYNWKEQRPDYDPRVSRGKSCLVEDLLTEAPAQFWTANSDGKQCFVFVTAVKEGIPEIEGLGRKCTILRKLCLVYCYAPLPKRVRSNHRQDKRSHQCAT